MLWTQSSVSSGIGVVRKSMRLSDAYGLFRSRASSPTMVVETLVLEILFWHLETKAAISSLDGIVISCSAIWRIQMVKWRVVRTL